MKGATLPEITQREFCHQEVLEAAWLRWSRVRPQQKFGLYRGVIVVHGWQSNVSGIHKQPSVQTGSESNTSVNILWGYS